MRIYLIAGVALLAMALVVPSMAEYVGDSGAFTYGPAVGFNLTNTSHAAGYLGPHLGGMWFRSASSIVAPGGFKVFLDCGQSDWFTSESNFTESAATLSYGGVPFSTGDLWFTRDSLTGDVWLSYFPTTWNPGGIMPNDNFCAMSWNTSKFDFKWEDAASTVNPEFQNNMISFAFAVSLGPGSYAPINPSPSAGSWGWYQLEYTDMFANTWETTEQSALYSNLVITRTFDGVTFNSRIMVNQSSLVPGGPNSTVFNSWGYGDQTLMNILNGVKYYIDCWDPTGRHYEDSFITNSTGLLPEAPGLGDLYVYTYDGSKGSLMDGVLVSIKGVTEPTYSGFAYSGALGTPGQVDFQVMTSHKYNISAAAPGYDTTYLNYTVGSVPATVNMILFPNMGYSTLEFYILNNATSNPVTGVPVNIVDHSTLAHNGKLTVSGFARFNTTSGHLYDWDVARGMCDCSLTSTPDSCYLPVSGNSTATAGALRLTVYLNTCTELGQGTGAGEDTISDPHAAAEGVMEMIYSMLPSLLMIVFLMLFVGVMDQRRRR